MDLEWIPPAERILELYDLARKGDMRRISYWADTAEAHDRRYTALAGRLRGLADNFKTRAIMTLVETLIEQSEISKKSNE